MHSNKYMLFIVFLLMLIPILNLLWASGVLIFSFFSLFFSNREFIHELLIIYKWGKLYNVRLDLNESYLFYANTLGITRLTESVYIE